MNNEEIKLIATRKLYLIFKKPTDWHFEHYLPMLIEDIKKNILFNKYTLSRSLENKKEMLECNI